MTQAATVLRDPTGITQPQAVGAGSWFDTIGDTVGKLAEMGISYERYRRERDVVGQGQHQMASTVETTRSTGRVPLTPEQMNPASTASGLALNPTTIAIGFGAVVVLALLLKR